MERTTEDISSKNKPKCLALGIGGGALAALMLVGIVAAVGGGGAWCYLQGQCAPAKPSEQSGTAAPSEVIGKDMNAEFSSGESGTSSTSSPLRRRLADATGKIALSSGVKIDVNDLILPGTKNSFKQTSFTEASPAFMRRGAASSTRRRRMSSRSVSAAQGALEEDLRAARDLVTEILVGDLGDSSSSGGGVIATTPLVLTGKKENPRYNTLKSPFFADVFVRLFNANGWIMLTGPYISNGWDWDVAATNGGFPLGVTGKCHFLRSGDVVEIIWGEGKGHFEFAHCVMPKSELSNIANRDNVPIKFTFHRDGGKTLDRHGKTLESATYFGHANASLAIHRHRARRGTQRYRFAVTNMFYNMAGPCGPGMPHCLVNWIEWKRMLGFTQFYLYDNGSTDNVRELLRPYVAAGIVTLISWPYTIGGTDNNKAQHIQLQHVQLAFGDTVEWLAFMDFDEFFRPTLRSEAAQWNTIVPEPRPRVDAMGFRIPMVLGADPRQCLKSSSAGSLHSSPFGIRMRDCNAEGPRRPAHHKLFLNLSAWYVSESGAIRPFVHSPHGGTGTRDSEFVRLLGSRTYPACGAYFVHFAKKYGCKSQDGVNERGEKTSACKTFYRDPMADILSRRMQQIWDCTKHDFLRSSRRQMQTCITASNLPTLREDDPWIFPTKDDEQYRRNRGLSKRRFLPQW